MTQESREEQGMYAIDKPEHATMIAALRWYQESGMGEPDHRSEAIHELATNGGEEISLDSDGIDALVEKLQFNNVAETVARLEARHARLLAALRAVHEASRMSGNSHVQYLEQIAAAGLKEAGEKTLIELSAETRSRAGVLLHHASPDDVAHVVRLPTASVKDLKGMSVEVVAAKAFDDLDFNRIERAAVEAGDDATAQRAAMHKAIATQLVEHGVLANTGVPRVANPGKSAALIAAASRTPEKLRDITGQIFGVPTSVTVVAVHASYPLECQAGGVMFPDGRVVIDYPFAWVGNGDQSFDADAQIDISHVVLPDGSEAPSWKDIGAEDMTAADYASLQRRLEAIDMSIAKGEDLPATDELRARLERIMERASWTIDMDSGQIIDKRWNIADHPTAGSEYRSIDSDFDGVVTVTSVSGDTVFYDGDAEGSARVSEFKQAYAPTLDLSESQVHSRSRMRG